MLYEVITGYEDEGSEMVYKIPIIYFMAPTIPDEGRLYSNILKYMGYGNDRKTSKYRNNFV